MANGQSQIAGVPPGVTLEPVPQNNTQAGTDASIQGVPAGVTMPADVAARHARSREGRDIQPSSQSFPTSVATGYAKEAVKTLEGVVNLANKALPSSLQIPTSEAAINQILPEGAERQKAL